MENIDLIILTTVVSISFIVFAAGTYSQFKKAASKDTRS
jgi:hypothetical protein